jgi:2-polyprenyl-6-methoxyphenol hydroxylase-like FAD-dependent oxidoreductase
MTEAPVLIAGGSLVGMSAALLLGHYGVPSLVVEHHRGTAIHPRAAQISQRTMEIFRATGVERIVRLKSDEQFVQDGAIMAVETLAGKELAWYISNLNEGVRDVSPTERVFISQSLLEPLLKTRAEELGAALRFGADLVSFEQDPDGVTATIRDRDSARTETVRARYMIAADGAHSAIRKQLGIPMRGRGAFSNSITIYFRANVAPLLRGRNLSVIYVLNEALRGFFRFEKPFDSGFLAVNAVGDPAHPITDVSAGLTEERCLELVRAALGADIPVKIENVMHWKAAADVAERWQCGRVFLAGDAAHEMQRRLWRKHWGSGRAQSGMEARAGSERDRPAGAALNLRAGAEARGRVYRRAGLFALRDAHRAIPRNRRNSGGRERSEYRAGILLPFGRGDSRNRRRCPSARESA